MDSYNGFVFDYAKCVGCHACLVACYNENQTAPPISWRTINRFNNEKLPLLGFIHQSIACNHCIEAPCLKACPSSAYYKDSATGAILHNADQCIGCKYCTWACPFDAPKFNERLGIIEKCNFCNQRLAIDKQPACTTNCPTGALSFGQIQSEQPKGFGISKKTISPRVLTLRAEHANVVPISNSDSIGAEPIDLVKFSKKGVTTSLNSKDEWPLALFTLIGSLLVGWFSATLIPTSITIPLWMFIILGFIGLQISVLHLGKPLRSYLSLNNLKTSWLSREILSFGLFSFIAFIAIILKSFTLVLIGSLIGVLFLFCVEMVYSVVKKKYNTIIHSANTVLTAAVFFAYFSANNNILLLLLVIKSALFIARVAQMNETRKPQNTIAAFFRLFLGFVLPIGLISFNLSSSYANWVLFAFILFAELVDRISYYNDIQAERPMDFEKDLLVQKN